MILVCGLACWNSLFQDTLETYTDVSVNMGPFCPNVQYRPALNQEHKKEVGLVDKVVKIDKTDESEDDRKDVLEQIVEEGINEGGDGRKYNPKFKFEEKAEENEIVKTGNHDLFFFLKEYLRRPANHDLLTIIRQNLGNLQELERHEIFKSNVQHLLSFLREKGVNRDEILTGGDHDLLTLLRQSLDNLPENESLEDGRVPPDYEHFTSKMPLLSPLKLIFTLSVTLSFSFPSSFSIKISSFQPLHLLGPIYFNLCRYLGN